MSCAEEVVYQAVTPGEPEQNGRCCLNGVSVDTVSVVVTAAVLGVSLRGFGVVGRPNPGSEVVGPLAAGGL